MSTLSVNTGRQYDIFFLTLHSVFGFNNVSPARLPPLSLDVRLVLKSGPGLILRRIPQMLGNAVYTRRSNSTIPGCKEAQGTSLNLARSRLSRHFPEKRGDDTKRALSLRL